MTLDERFQQTDDDPRRAVYMAEIAVALMACLSLTSNPSRRQPPIFDAHNPLKRFCRAG